MQDLGILAQIVILTSLLPVLLRILDLPALMRLLTPSGGRAEPPAALDSDRVVWLTDLVLGRAPRAHSTCLVRSLILYRLLAKGGEEVQIHVGVQRKGDRLAAHSWLTRAGQSVGESSGQNGFTEIYVYPARSGTGSSLPGKGHVPCV